MTRIFTDGAEMRDTLFFVDATGVTIQSTNPIPYLGSYYYDMGNSDYIAIAAISECYFRERIYIANGFETTQMTYPGFFSGGTKLAWLLINAGKWQISTSGGILATSSSLNVATLGRWYLVEVYFKLADNPDGRFTIKVDGTTVIDFTGDTKPGADTTFDRIYFTAWSQGLKLDDLALNDTSGSSDNSWCGDGWISKITPDGEGTDKNWICSSGSTHYQMVDEFPHTTDTDYNWASGSSTSVQDQYTMSDYSGSSRRILRIWTEARVRKTAADSSIIKLGYKPSGGVDRVSGSIALTTSYTRVVGNDALINPDTSGSWVEADLDAIETVIEVG